ncbi:hypothetical protein AAFF_G00149870 [Aldrovandia affinis]|uniref:Fibronectin type-III domain-containing protein n=1 Tax=Aldrovandia affinis TaxID=143900 RepID=A0AAD7W8X9_9TELE|nr:hypothetical protein AAFF_G00149870 [Aldrovandia affinis]
MTKKQKLRPQAARPPPPRCPPSSRGGDPTDTARGEVQQTGRRGLQLRRRGGGRGRRCRGGREGEKEGRHAQLPPRPLRPPAEAVPGGVPGQLPVPGPDPRLERPGAPHDRDAQDVTSSSAEVHWCAPYSSVSGYELEVRPEGGGAPVFVHAVGPTFRRLRVTGPAGRRAYAVCVRARNRAGPSPPACAALTTATESCAALLYGLAAAAAGLAVLALGLAVCLCRQCRRPLPENPRASSLISIPNPAYCHPQERADTVLHLRRG